MKTTTKPYVVADAACPRCDGPIVYWPLTGRLTCAAVSCDGPYHGRIAPGQDPTITLTAATLVPKGDR